MDYSLWGHKQSDTTEHTHTHTFVIGPFVDLSSATITIKAAITGAVGLLLGLDWWDHSSVQAAHEIRALKQQKIYIYLT